MENVIEQHIAGVQTERQRLSEYCLGIFETLPTRNSLKKAIAKGLVLLNGNTASTADFIKEGDEISLLREKVSKHKILELNIDVLLEDDHLAIVRKPAGIEVSGNMHRTLSNALPFNLKKSDLKDALQAPKPVHRLDYPTEGLLLVAKTSSTHLALRKLFDSGEINKVYHAISIGEMEKQGVVEEPVDEKPSKSSFNVIASVVSERFDLLNLLELIPHTGRRHQLRKHMAFLGNPILGDPQYSKEGQLLKGKGLYLHASSISFKHPVTSENISINLDLPQKFRKIFKHIPFLTLDPRP